MRKLILSSLILLFLSTSSYGGEIDEKLHKQCIFPTIIVGSEKGYGTGFVIRSEKELDNKYRMFFYLVRMLLYPIKETIK